MLVFFRSKVVETYGYKNHKNTRFRGESLIHLIWMFPDRIPSNEDIEEDFETIENTVGLICLTVFHSVPYFMDPITRERWAFLSLSRWWLRFIYLEFKKIN